MHGCPSDYLLVVADGRYEEGVLAEAGERVRYVPADAAEPEGDAARVRSQMKLATGRPICFGKGIC